MKINLVHTVFFLFLFILSSCSVQRQWIRKHPGASSFSKSSTVGIVPASSQLLLRNSTELVEKTGFPAWKLYQILSTQIDSIFISKCNEHQKSITSNPACSTFGDIVVDSLPWKGSFPLDKGTFLNVQWPAQDDSTLNNAPDFLIILHEIHVGFNLNRSEILDNQHNSQNNPKSKQKLKPVSFNFIAICSLWDSKRNDWSKIGAIKTSIPAPLRTLNPNDFIQLIQKGAQQVFSKLQEKAQ